MKNLNLDEFEQDILDSVENMNGRAKMIVRRALLSCKRIFEAWKEKSGFNQAFWKWSLWVKKKESGKWCALSKYNSNVSPSIHL